MGAPCEMPRRGPSPTPALLTILAVCLPFLTPLEAAQTAQFCIQNRRSEPLRAYWSEDKYDNAMASTETCYTVYLPSHYRLKTYKDELLLDVEFNGDKKVEVDACVAKIDCTGHGVCIGSKCHCDNGTDTGHWTGPMCNTCLPGFFGPQCTQFCNSNGILDPGEQCDDGNLRDNDGCSGCLLDEEVEMYRVNVFWLWLLVVSIFGCYWWASLPEKKKNVRANI